MQKTAVLLLIALVGLSSCFWHGRRVKGNGKVTTESRQLGNISGVELHSSFDVYLTQGSPAGVRIEAEENIIPHIALQVYNDVLNIETENDTWLQTHRPVKIYVTSPVFNSIECSGSGNIHSQTKISNDSKLKVSSSGSGDINIEADAPEVEAGISGSGSIELAGETKKIVGDVSGAGHLKAMDLKAEESDLNVSGSGNVQVYSSVKVKANISGSGDVRYKGDAQVTSDVSGSGSIKKVN
jgi:hypothetical protein